MVYDLNFDDPLTTLAKCPYDKKENIRKMYEILQQAYKKRNNNSEVVVIFPIDNKSAGRIYQTEKDAYVEVDPENPQEAHRVKIDSQVADMKAKFCEINGKDAEFIATFFHNHRQGTNFSNFDFVAFFKFYFLKTIYLDATDLCVCYKSTMYQRKIEKSEIIEIIGDINRMQHEIFNLLVQKSIDDSLAKLKLDADKFDTARQQLLRDFSFRQKFNKNIWWRFLDEFIKELNKKHYIQYYIIKKCRTEADSL